MSKNAAEGVLIAPSILAADFAAFGAECQAVEEAGADWIHVDIMDGHFVPNISFGADVCKALRPHIRTHMDVHLMIAPADPYLQAFADAGADRLTVHAEAGPHLHRSLQTIRALGLGAGVALNPATPASALLGVLDLIDLVCVMTVNPGFGGQSFLRDQLGKISQIRDMIEGRDVRIEVDGGVDADTAPMAVAAGADVLVAGSSVFRAPGANRVAAYRARIEGIRAALPG